MPPNNWHFVHTKCQQIVRDQHIKLLTHFDYTTIFNLWKNYSSKRKIQNYSTPTILHTSKTNTQRTSKHTLLTLTTLKKVSQPRIDHTRGNSAAWHAFSVFSAQSTPVKNYTPRTWCKLCMTTEMNTSESRGNHAWGNSYTRIVKLSNPIYKMYTPQYRADHTKGKIHNLSVKLSETQSTKPILPNREPITPGEILTSMMWNWDPIYLQAYFPIQRGSHKGKYSHSRYVELLDPIYKIHTSQSRTDQIWWNCSHGVKHADNRKNSKWTIKTCRSTRPQNFETPFDIRDLQLENILL